MSKRHTEDSLAVLLFEEQIGTIETQSDGIVFKYLPSAAVPLSVSMLDLEREYAGHRVKCWFDGLLPDGVLTRSIMSRNKPYGPNSTFGLLSDYGLDLPGAVQVAPLQQLESIISDDTQDYEYEKVSLSEVGERIEKMVTESARHAGERWHTRGERWSLAGGQPKFALMRDADGNYYECQGNAPSNVIIKPGVTGMETQAEIECLCLKIAQEIGLPTASSEIVNFEGINAIVVERYDREIDANSRIKRYHQEDFCQALGLPPTNKYMEGKNPTLHAISMLKKTENEASLDMFADSLLFNYLIGAPDGHLKNHSLLHSDIGIIMAPIYDVASGFPYLREDYNLHTALPIGRERRIGKVGKKALSDLAKDMRKDSQKLIERFCELSELIPIATAKVIEENSHLPNIDRIATSFLPRVEQHCQYAESNIGKTTFSTPNLYAAPGSISLDDGNYNAKQRTIQEEQDDIIFRDPITGDITSESIYDKNAYKKTKAAMKNFKHSSRSSCGDGRVWVSPHVRKGTKVNGYWRSPPGHRK